MPAQMKLTAITLDCPDPLALAAFYQQATGLELHDESNGDFAGLTRGDRLCIGFQRVDDYQAPRWPDQTVPQQVHLDFAVDDLDEAEAVLLELGAVKPEFQPGGARGSAFRSDDQEHVGGAALPRSWGNTDLFLHAHAWPQSEWEPADLAVSPVWLYPRERSGPTSGPDQRGPALSPDRSRIAARPAAVLVSAQLGGGH